MARRDVRKDNTGMDGTEKNLMLPHYIAIGASGGEVWIFIPSEPAVQ
jgi:hypothetical protein